jgi:hypothetical protein
LLTHHSPGSKCYEANTRNKGGKEVIKIRGGAIEETSHAQKYQGSKATPRRWPRPNTYTQSGKEEEEKLEKVESGEWRSRSEGICRMMKMEEEKERRKGKQIQTTELQSGTGLDWTPVGLKL